ncbi:MAG: circadian clock KaiB family protein [Methanomicrobiales archaeon]|nr:circadian clock KaiB family protein [Methanomicrobiales archaeon]MDD1678322.1 circadian clock KaiB family protein [Methanomicrobiales archaeon]
MAKKAGRKKTMEGAVEESLTKKYVLRLYVSGITPRSRVAIENIKRVCEENLKGRYDLEVIDIYQQPERIKEDQIVAAPTLIKKLPLPLRKIIGDMSSTDRILIGLDLTVKG